VSRHPLSPTVLFLLLALLLLLLVACHRAGVCMPSSALGVLLVSRHTLSLLVPLLLLLLLSGGVCLLVSL
jgi:hypothetical protein